MRLVNNIQKRYLQTKMLHTSAQAFANFYRRTVVEVALEPGPLLRPPDTARTCRSSYPILLTPAMSNAHLWDVTSSRPISVVWDT